MRKRITDQDQTRNLANEGNWLDLEHMVQVEVTSEDPDFPIESALTENGHTGWKASKAGRQTIRILFDEPQQIHKIQLVFTEEQQARTQEFVLRWGSANEESYREIVRQQYTFSPDSTTREQENYTVNLQDLKVLVLNIEPDLSGSDARASLSSLRIA